MSILASGQAWKLAISLVLPMVAVVCFAAGIIVMDQSDTAFSVLMISYTVMFVSVVVWTVLSLVCPFCRARIVWLVLRRLPHQESLQIAFFSLTHCPSCRRSLRSHGSHDS